MNGWKNHATWNMNNWYGDLFDGLAEDGIEITGDALLEFVWEYENFDSMPIGFVKDAAMAAFNSVDWDELAAHYYVPVEDEEDEEFDSMGNRLDGLGAYEDA
jgi:hypothetical protein